MVFFGFHTSDGNSRIDLPGSAIEIPSGKIQSVRTSSEEAILCCEIKDCDGWSRGGSQKSHIARLPNKSESIGLILSGMGDKRREV